MDELKYIIVRKTAYLSNFTGDFSDLVNRISSETLTSLELLNVETVAWGVEGEEFESLENFPRYSA